MLNIIVAFDQKNDKRNNECMFFITKPKQKKLIDKVVNVFEIIITCKNVF